MLLYCRSYTAENCVSTEGNSAGNIENGDYSGFFWKEEFSEALMFADNSTSKLNKILIELTVLQRIENGPEWAKDFE